ISRLDHLPTEKELIPAAPAITKWLPTLEATNAHRDQVERRLARMLAALPDVKLTELPGVLQRYRETCPQDGKRTTFNRTRSDVQAFLRDVVGPAHRLWNEAAAVGKLKETPR